MKYTPKPVDRAASVFGPRKISDYLPDYADVPEPYKRWHGNQHVEVVERWFFRGLPEGTQFVPKPGIDAEAALAHISACMRSWEPKHEHKTAGVAYLLSEWFERIEIPETDA